MVVFKSSIDLKIILAVDKLLKLIVLSAMCLLLVSNIALAESRHSHASSKHMHHHDEVNMPGLRGENASAEETSDLAVLFRNFETLSREVGESSKWDQNCNTLLQFEGYGSTCATCCGYDWARGTER